MSDASTAQKSRGVQPRGSASAVPAEVRWTEFPDCPRQSRDHGSPRGNKTAYCVRGSAMPRAWRPEDRKRVNGVEWHPA
jgi:hypothetical protein